MMMVLRDGSGHFNFVCSYRKEKKSLSRRKVINIFHATLDVGPTEYNARLVAFLRKNTRLGSQVADNQPSCLMW